MILRPSCRLSLGDAQFELGQYRAAATYDDLAAMIPLGTVESRVPGSRARRRRPPSSATPRRRRDLDQRPPTLPWFTSRLRLQAGARRREGTSVGLRIAPAPPSLELPPRPRRARSIADAERRYRTWSRYTGRGSARRPGEGRACAGHAEVAARSRERTSHRPRPTRRSRRSDATSHRSSPTPSPRPRGRRPRRLRRPSGHSFRRHPRVGRVPNRPPRGRAPPLTSRAPVRDSRPRITGPGWAHRSPGRS